MDSPPSSLICFITDVWESGRSAEILVHLLPLSFDWKILDGVLKKSENSEGNASRLVNFSRMCGAGYETSLSLRVGGAASLWRWRRGGGLSALRSPSSVGCRRRKREGWGQLAFDGS